MSFNANTNSQEKDIVPSLSQYKEKTENEK